MNWLFIAMVFCICYGDQANANTEKVEDLEYGAILFDYFQQNYFSALIEYEYANKLGALISYKNEARLLKGGMMLSYGLADQAQKIFLKLLNDNESEPVRNKAWFYLAKLYYQKGNTHKALHALGEINGQIPAELEQEFYYLVSLINIETNNLDAATQGISQTGTGQYKAYLLFNLAVIHAKNNNIEQARSNLKQVIEHGKMNFELSVLSERAKHAQALLFIQEKDLPSAWQSLKGIHTSGLYSNRALLTYGWTAIGMKMFNEAIPALKILNNKSITISEVQEAKVLLPHLYEQQGAKRKALENFLIAERELNEGIVRIEKARQVIEKQDVPEEFVKNLEAIMDETDWYGTQVDIDYKKLTPFLIELMASHSFQISMKELRDLYAIRKNLVYWSIQAPEHKLILNNKGSNLTKQHIAKHLKKVNNLYEKHQQQIGELRLHKLVLDEKNQDRFQALISTTEQEFNYLYDKIKQLKKIDKPYKQPTINIKHVNTLHSRVKEKLKETNGLIIKLEKIMRSTINTELDKHQKRMMHYSIQARLAKTRLYDATFSKNNALQLGQHGRQK